MVANIEDATWLLELLLALVLRSSFADTKIKKARTFLMAEAELSETLVQVLLVQSLLKASEDTAARAESVLDLTREAVTADADRHTGVDHGQTLILR